ncbi:MAG: hypothetical protein QM758_10805 [Armatimonas sp.]
MILLPALIPAALYAPDSAYFRLRPLATFDGVRFGDITLGTITLGDVKKRWRYNTKRLRQQRSIELLSPRPDGPTLSLLEGVGKDAKIEAIWMDLSDELLTVEGAKEEIGPGAVTLYEPQRREDSLLLHWPDSGILLFCRGGDVEEAILAPPEWTKRLLRLPTTTMEESPAPPRFAVVQVGRITLEPAPDQREVHSEDLSRLKERLDFPTTTVTPGGSGSIVARVGGARGADEEEYKDSEGKKRKRTVPWIRITATISVEGMGPYDPIHLVDSTTRQIRINDDSGVSIETRVTNAIEVAVTSLAVSANQQLSREIDAQAAESWTRRRWEQRLAMARGERP